MEAVFFRRFILNYGANGSILSNKSGRTPVGVDTHSIGVETKYPQTSLPQLILSERKFAAV